MEFEQFDFAGLGLSDGAPVLVGVVNVTPDSFSDGSLFVDTPAVLAHCDALLESGAALLDLGAEATGPGSSPITESIEHSRLSPILGVLTHRAPRVSIDTYKSGIARAALQAGCRVINDVSALRADPALAEVVAEFNAYLVLMYAKDSPLPHVSSNDREYSDVVAYIADFLCRQFEQAVSYGVAPNRIVVDPGMGKFVSNTSGYSFEILKGLSRLRTLGVKQPIMIGASRKGFLGGALRDRDPVSQLAGLIAYLHGATFIRTHNVAMASEFLKLWDRAGKVG